MLKKEDLQKIENLLDQKLKTEREYNDHNLARRLKSERDYLDQRFKSERDHFDQKLKLELKPLKSDLAKVRRDISVIIDFFDREYLSLRARVERIESFLKLPPLSRE